MGLSSEAEAYDDGKNKSASIKGNKFLYWVSKCEFLCGSVLWNFVVAWSVDGLVGCLVGCSVVCLTGLLAGNLNCWFVP